MPKDITDAAHDRGHDGQLLPVERTVEIHGEAFEAEIYPATTGQRNEWQHRLRNEAQELSDDVEADLLDEFAVNDPDDFGAETWTDVRPGIVDALGEAILAEIFDTPQDEFQQALEQVSADVEGNPN